MIVPNHKFITENVMNWTHLDVHSAAFRVQVRAGYEVDGQQLTEILNTVVMDHPDVLTKDPERLPQIALLEFQEKCVLYEVRFWTEKQFEADQVQSALRFAIHEQMRKLGISLPKE
jgi:small-conductance mechanosensitive channel